jgi:serine/threonine protein kinase
MSDAAHTGGPRLSPAAARRIDQVCDRFEEAWLAGLRPRVEDFLGEVLEPERAALQAELLQVEHHYHSRLTASVPASATPAAGDTALPGADRPSPEGGPAAASTVDHGPSEGLPPAPGPGEVPAGPGAIGKYRVVEFLGRGGQADVYRAVDPALRRDVVIKWAHRSLTPAAQQRLLAEGRILARLEDPGMVRVHDADLHEGRPFLVFAYVPGRSLAERLRDRPQSFRAAAALTADLAAILGRAHRQGVLHRDLKPANVLLDDSGRRRLMDFGLATLRESWDESPRPGEGVCGTYPYMAPEQARAQTDRIGPRTDVFGLGAVLYHLLTGRPLYQGSDRASVLAQAREARVTPPRQLNPRIPRPLERICLKALAAEPGQRYGSAEAMERALLAYLRRPLLLGAAAALVLCAAILAFVLPGWLARESPPSGGGEVRGNKTVPLTGKLRVRVWSAKGGEDKKGLEIGEDFRALPVHNKERLRIEASLNEPAHAYLLWLDSEGVVFPLYPWNEAGIRERRLVVPAPRPPTKQVFSPADQPDKSTGGWVMGGKSGLETILLLARRDPLPADVNLAQLLGKAPLTPLRDPLEFAIRGGDEGQPVGQVHRGEHRGPEAEVEAIDDPLLQLMGRLRPHFEVIRAVRFAHQGGQ